MKYSPGVLVLALALFGVNLHAQSDEEYYSRLGVIQKFAHEQKIKALFLLEATSYDPVSALSRLGLQRHVFTVGRQWTVAVTPKIDSRGRPPISSAEPLPERLPEPVLYDFKVLSVEAGVNARVEVRERVTGPVGATRVDHLVLLVSPQFVVLAKEIHHVNGRPMHAVEFGGGANVALGFEAYPIDLPDLATAEYEPARDIPKAALKYLRVGVEHVLDFHFNDLFARPVRALWAEGDVWPLYYENTAFTAVVISKGAGS